MGKIPFHKKPEPLPALGLGGRVTPVGVRAGGGTERSGDVC